MTLPLIRYPLQGRFLKRLNRFSALVEIGGQTLPAYLPNSGRLEDLLRPGALVILEKRRDRGKTHHDLLLIQTPRFPDGKPIWAGLDSRWPPVLLSGAIRSDGLPFLPAATRIQTEPRRGRGRLDLKLHTPDGRCYLVETKSVNLLDRSGTARFPDAPTARGARHLEELIGLQGSGCIPWVVFVILREDAQAFAPFRERDPRFSDLLEEAVRRGVGVYALKFALTPQGARYLGPIPLHLPPPPFPGFWPPENSIR